MILSEFDNDKEAIINPSHTTSKIENFPKVGITCFSKQLIDVLVETFKGKVIAEVSTANGIRPIYKIGYKNKEFVLFMSSVGAPACVGIFEEIISMGLEKLVMFGTCGTLVKEIVDLGIIIPTSAIRDEGTSYHYMEASDEVSVNEKYREEFKEILKRHNYSYVEGKTWTTDAFYRETKAKVSKRKEAGCICVEMECASMSAVAKFREVDFFEFFYAADNLDGAVWDKRSLDNEERLTEKEQICYLSLELALVIS
jgi:Uridine phosphorylase